jgi:hypothetical protein
MDLDIYNKIIHTDKAETVEFGDSTIFKPVETDPISGGILRQDVGKTAGYDDPGHKDADAFFYVLSGEADRRYPERNRTVNLSAGNFILSERDKPHVVLNSVKEDLVLLYACCAEK